MNINAEEAEKHLIDGDKCKISLNKIKDLVEFNALSLSSKWYGELGIPRNKVQELLDDV